MTSERKLIAVTRSIHGLGNRVRVVLGSRALARRENRSFSYVWPVDRRFGARFDELWRFDEPQTSPVRAALLSTRLGYRDHTLDWLGDGARQERTWLIRTAHALHLPDDTVAWEEDLRSLEPAREVADAVLGFHRGVLRSEPYLGVMVRAHTVSHEQTLTASPVQWYVDRLTALRREHPDLRIFISADDPAAQAVVESAVPGVFGLRDKGGYNTREGLVSAVTDLYLLAGSVHLIGPHFSSFPELAQKLAGDPLRLETSRTPPETAFDDSVLTWAQDPTRPHVREPLTLS